MFAERLKIITDHMHTACVRAGRDPAHSVQLVAVSKTHPPASLLEAVDSGVTLFGENRVQEAKAKIPLLPSRCRWHFIGHLQKNKIRQALPLFELLHGVDSLAIARDVDRIASELGLFPKILFGIFTIAPVLYLLIFSVMFIATIVMLVVLLAITFFVMSFIQ
jgi:uncharacterized pyridoxal phosphate-containing UPF0001 family protein